MPPSPILAKWVTPHPHSHMLHPGKVSDAPYSTLAKWVTPPCPTLAKWVTPPCPILTKWVIPLWPTLLIPPYSTPGKVSDAPLTHPGDISLLCPGKMSGTSLSHPDKVSDDPLPHPSNALLLHPGKVSDAPLSHFGKVSDAPLSDPSDASLLHPGKVSDTPLSHPGKVTPITPPKVNDTHLPNSFSPSPGISCNTSLATARWVTGHISWFGLVVRQKEWQFWFESWLQLCFSSEICDLWTLSCDSFVHYS